MQGGASSLGCGVTVSAACGRGLATQLGRVCEMGSNLQDLAFWTGVGFQANLVEEHVLRSAFLHGSVGLERTWGHHWLAVAHGLYHPPLLIPFRRY